VAPAKRNGEANKEPSGIKPMGEPKNFLCTSAEDPKKKRGCAEKDPEGKKKDSRNLAKKTK